MREETPEENMQKLGQPAQSHFPGPEALQQTAALLGATERSHLRACKPLRDVRSLTDTTSPFDEADRDRWAADRKGCSSGSADMVAWSKRLLGAVLPGQPRRAAAGVAHPVGERRVRRVAEEAGSLSASLLVFAHLA